MADAGARFRPSCTRPTTCRCLNRDGWAPYRQFTEPLHQTCLGHLLGRCRLLQRDHARACFLARIVRILHQALARRDQLVSGASDRPAPPSSPARCAAAAIARPRGPTCSKSSPACSGPRSSVTSTWMPASPRCFTHPRRSCRHTSIRRPLRPTDSVNQIPNSSLTHYGLFATETKARMNSPQ